jgi:hypothetical protein
MIRVLLDLFEDWLNSSCIESFLAHGTSAAWRLVPHRDARFGVA